MRSSGFILFSHYHLLDSQKLYFGALSMSLAVIISTHFLFARYRVNKEYVDAVMALTWIHLVTEQMV